MDMNKLFLGEKVFLIENEWQKDEKNAVTYLPTFNQRLITDTENGYRSENTEPMKKKFKNFLTLQK